MEVMQWNKTKKHGSSDRNFANTCYQNLAKTIKPLSDKYKSFHSLLAVFSRIRMILAEKLISQSKIRKVVSEL